MPEYPNYYSTSLNLSTSTGGGITDGFGFNATFLRVANRGSETAYFNLQGNAASTGDMEVASSGEFAQAVPRIAGIGIFSTAMNSSSTTDLTRTLLNIVALGPL